MPRRARRIDANQPEIVAALRGCGWFVEPRLARVGDGVPDLLCARSGRWYVVEVKDGAKPPSARALTTKEAGWHAAARVVGGADVVLIESVGDVIDWAEKVK